MILHLKQAIRAFMLPLTELACALRIPIYNARLLGYVVIYV